MVEVADEEDTAAPQTAMRMLGAAHLQTRRHPSEQDSNMIRTRQDTAGIGQDFRRQEQRFRVGELTEWEAALGISIVPNKATDGATSLEVRGVCDGWACKA